MSLTDGKADERPKTQRPLPKKGPRAAVLTGIIDVGVQIRKYKGELKAPRQEFIPIFMLINDTYQTDEGETFNFRLSPFPVKHFPGATRGHYFDLYNALDPNHTVLTDMGEGNIYDLIGLTCFVNVVYKDPTDDGIVYANMVGVSELPEDYPVDVPDFDPLLFKLEEPSKEVFDNLYDYTQKHIRGSVGDAVSEAEAILEGDASHESKQEEEDDDSHY